MVLLAMTTQLPPAKARKIVFGCMLFFLLVTATISGLGFFYITSPHLWKRWSVASVALDGQPAESSAVYRSREGDILIRLQHPDSTMPTYYVIKPQSAKVGFPPSQGLLIPLLGQIYSYQAPLITILLDGTEAKMDRLDAELKLTPQSAEFISLKKQRVVVRWETINGTGYPDRAHSHRR